MLANLSKQALINIIVDTNNLEKLTIEQFLQKEKEFQKEKQRRKLERVKKELLLLYNVSKFNRYMEFEEFKNILSTISKFNYNYFEMLGEKLFLYPNINDVSLMHNSKSEQFFLMVNFLMECFYGKRIIHSIYLYMIDPKINFTEPVFYDQCGLPLWREV